MSARSGHPDFGVMENLVSAEGEGQSQDDWPSPVYISKHLSCPKCGEPMRLYVGLWMCWCGHEEPCCE
jgi:hypothetical protein